MLVGHWENIQEAEKLTQTTLIGGLVTEYVKRGGILGLSSPGIPVAQHTGLDVLWNREKDVPVASSVDPIGARLVWQSGTNFDQLRANLRSVYIQTYLDNYVQEVYQTLNNYRAIQLQNNARSMVSRIETLLIYGHKEDSPGNLEFDGFHTIASRYKKNYHGMNLDFDSGSNGLSIHMLRQLVSNMRHGIDYLIMSDTLAMRFDEMVQEGGFVGSSSRVVNSRMTYGKDELGNAVSFWNGIPIIRSDWMVEELENSGLNDSSRRLPSAGSGIYSILAVKFGQVYRNQPGLTLTWGARGALRRGQIWKTVLFEKFEDIDAEGIRHIGHYGILDGSTMAIGRITDIADAPLRQ